MENPREMENGHWERQDIKGIPWGMAIGTWTLPIWPLTFYEVQVRCPWQCPKMKLSSDYLEFDGDHSELNMKNWTLDIGYRAMAMDIVDRAMYFQCRS